MAAKNKPRQRRGWKSHLIWGSVCAGILAAGSVFYIPAMNAALDAQRRAGEAEERLADVENRLELALMDAILMQGNNLRTIAKLKRQNSVYEVWLSAVPRDVARTIFLEDLVGIQGNTEMTQEQFIVHILKPQPSLKMVNADVQDMVEGIGTTEVCFLNLWDFERLGSSVICFPPFPDTSFVAQPDTKGVVERGEIGIVAWEDDERWFFDGFDAIAVIYWEPPVLKD